jgi:glucose-6-phosphate 1-dehydrogenase
MSSGAPSSQATQKRHPGAAPTADPCILVVFGASGDLTKRLLIPALYNLTCDRLLSPRFALVGMSRTEMSSEQFRAQLTEDIKQFTTRSQVDSRIWEEFAARVQYVAGDYDAPAGYQRLAKVIEQIQNSAVPEGNLLVYLATPPVLFGKISRQVIQAGLAKRDRGWTRIIVEKPFGHDLASAVELNRALLDSWAEDQIYRIDHYLGKETVQNLLAFRFSNAIFEPIWNKTYVDHIQLTVSETVGVEGRGKYYDRTGVLRDMIQNHMFQMLAYLCMEPPASFRPDAVRNEKVKLLDAVRIMKPEEVAANAVRGQYAAGKKVDGSPTCAYRDEPDVNPQSTTETCAALRLFIDNWRWEGVPIYLRSGKGLWKRGTEIVVQFRKAPEALYRDMPPEDRPECNRLVFLIQPDQGAELRFHAKAPGPTISLQKVNMRFDYKEAFEAQRGTGYEVLFYNAMIGDATLFSRTDLVETAWKIAQPILDEWERMPAADFPNYPAGSWGPKAAYELLECDGRQWAEVFNRSVLEKVPLFKGGSPTFFHNLALMVEPVVATSGELIISKGDPGAEMYFICRGEVEVQDEAGTRIATLGPGDFFGEQSLLLSQPRNASVRAVSPCNLFVLKQADFQKVLKDHPDFATCLREAATGRGGVKEGGG